MSKPLRIFLIRHGQSAGNEDVSLYNSVPDFAMPLTEKGKQQAQEAGQKLRAEGPGRFFFYISSYRRTRETFEGIAEAFNREDFEFREDPRIIEQSWVGSLPAGGFDRQAEKDREAYSSFYYRFTTGESNVEVYTRVSSFLDTLHRDFEKEDYPENVGIICHGMTLRVFLMRWFHWTVEEFEAIRNPQNCAIIELALGPDGRYQLVTDLPKYPKSTHNHQYPLKIK